MKTLFNLIVYAAVAYALLIVVLYFYQSRMVFLAHVPGRTLEATPEHIGLNYESLMIATQDGEQIHGWYVFAPVESGSRGVVLFFHGNAGNISHRLDSIANFIRMGLDVLIIDYRGYGQSTGKATEEGLYLDAEAAWQYLLQDRNISAEKVIIFGRSLGSVAAASIASQNRPGGVILESSFTSGLEMAKKLYWFLPARLFVRLKFPVSEFVRSVDAPVLVIHSSDDEIIPFELGRAVFEAVGSADKQFLEIYGGHNTGFILSEHIYLPAVKQFIDKAL